MVFYEKPSQDDSIVLVHWRFQRPGSVTKIYSFTFGIYINNRNNDGVEIMGVEDLPEKVS